MIEIALAYLNLGWCPIPMKEQSSSFTKKVPYVKWKEFQTRRPKEDEIRVWWSKWPRAGIGIVTGLISGIIAIDFDGLPAQYKYKEIIGNRPNTISFTSREGHEQDLYKYPDGQIIKNITGFLEGVDIRGNGGLVVVPPTKHWSGSIYSWGPINPFEDGLDDLLEIPKGIFNLLLRPSEQMTQSKPSSKKRSKKQKGIMPDWMWDIRGGVEEGRRTDCCTKMVGWYLRHYRGDVNMTLLALEGWNAKCKPPLTPAELESVILSIAKRQGVNELAERCGISIDKVIFYKAPDGDSKFEMFVNNSEDSIILMPGDLASNIKFRTKILGYTGILPDGMENKEFVPLIQKALKEAKIKNLESDLTHEGFVVETIQKHIIQPGKNLSQIEICFVVIENLIYFKMSVLKKAIDDRKEDFLSRFEIARILKNLGFKQSRPRDNKGKQIRIWMGSKKDFENYFDFEEAREIFK